MTRYDLDDYCNKCWHPEDKCTCEQCANCHDFFPLHKLYDFNTLAVSDE